MSTTFTCHATSPYGAILQYLWDFNNDGFADKITTVGRVAYKYTGVGTHQAKVTVVDSAGNRAESAPVTVKVGNGPELYAKIEYYQLDNTTNTVRVKARVYNSGNVAAAPSSAAFSVSDNGANAAAFKTAAVPALGPNKSALLDASHVFPESIYGRQISLAVDSGKRVAEVDETNNGAKIAAAPAAGTLLALPNAGGRPLDVKFLCRAPKSLGKVAQYLWDFSSDGLPDKITAAGAVATRFAANGKFSTKATAVGSAGHADCGPAAVTVGDGPELSARLEGYTYDEAAKTVRVKARLYNTGNVAASLFNAAFSVSDNGAGASVFKTVPVANLAPGQSRLLDVSQTFPESAYGRQISLAVDSGKRVAEVDEANNSLKITLGPAATR